MRKECGGENDETAGGKLDNQLQIPEDKMPPQVLVELPTRKNGTAAGDEVERIEVGESTCLRAHVEVTSGEGAVGEITLELRVVVHDVL